VAFGLEERRLPRDQVRARTEAALELVGLTGFGERRPNQLSGGQQQRVALARTLAIEPQVLLLDEPLSNLDAKLRIQMRRELLSLHKRLGITTIFVTHDQEEALTMCDRIAVLDQGVIQQIGTPVELFDRPVNRFVAQFVGSVNLFGGSIRQTDAGAVFDSELGEIRLPGSLAPEGAQGELAFRPHVVSLDGTGTPDALRLEGTVEASEFLGEFIRYEVRVRQALVIADQAYSRGARRLEAGAAVQMAISPQDLRLIA
jgi:iron(III) transport system ATP-binding protein